MFDTRRSTSEGFTKFMIIMYYLLDIYDETPGIPLVEKGRVDIKLLTSFAFFIKITTSMVSLWGKGTEELTQKILEYGYR